jgi:hypothetical protein
LDDYRATRAAASDRGGDVFSVHAAGVFTREKEARGGKTEAAIGESLPVFDGQTPFCG